VSDYLDIPSPHHTGPGTSLVRVRADSPEALAWLARQPKPRPARGPGTELKKLLASWGITDSPQCPCNARAAEMDRQGAAWCRANREAIIGWMEEGAAAWGWLAALAAKALPIGRLVDMAIARAEFTPITTRNLLYHAAPFSGNGAPWRRGVKNIMDRLPLFNGRRVVAIMTGPGMDPPGEVRRAFGGDAEFIEMPNVPGGNHAAGREVISFLPLFEAIANTSPTEATFYGHTKGATQNNGHTAHLWGDVMAELCLDYWPVVDRLLREFPVAGSFRKNVKAWSAHDGFDSASDWHYSGSFFWFRHDQLFSKPDWRRIDQFYSGIESYPSLHFGREDAGVIFEPQTQVGSPLYLWDYWATHVLPRLATWRAEHAGERRMP
jgi:hypothetical protein